METTSNHSKMDHRCASAADQLRDDGSTQEMAVRRTPLSHPLSQQSGPSTDAAHRRSPVSARTQQTEEAGDVSRLPAAPAAGALSSDITDHLRERSSNRHQEALRQLETHLSELRQVYEGRVRSINLEGISSLQDVDLRLNTWRNRMELMDDVSLQEVHGMWEEVQEQLKQKKVRTEELKVRLTQSEAETTEQIRLALAHCCHLLDKINFLPSTSVCRLIHSQATMLNGLILGNRRSVAQLMLLLQEETLQQESLLRLNWEEHVSHWRSIKVQRVIQSFRERCCSEDPHRLLSDQHLAETQSLLTHRRHDIITAISSLVPPTCSCTLVCDWFSQLTAVNLQIETLYTDFLHQLRSFYKRQWDERLADLQRCQEALSSLQLPAEQVAAVASCHLLSLIGQSRRRDEEHLTAVQLQCESAAGQAAALSRAALAVLRGAAALWESHQCGFGRRRGGLQLQLQQLRQRQQRRLQVEKACLSELLTGLRQESSEAALRSSLEQTSCCLQAFTLSCSQSVCDQYQLLDLLPSLHVEEFFSYSNHLRSFFHIHPLSTPNLDELNKFLPSWSRTTTRDQMPEELSPQTEPEPPTTLQDWLTEAEVSLLELYDISSQVPVPSSKSVSHTGPTFLCPAHDTQQMTHLSPFPLELLTEELSRMRTLFLEHLEQHLHDVINSAVTMVTQKKEVIHLEQQIQLNELNMEHIQTRIYQPRLAELHLHHQRVELLCQQLRAVVASCRAELQELQTSIRRRNNDFVVMVTNMEPSLMTRNSSQLLDDFSSALQGRLDAHLKHTQGCQSSFRMEVQLRLEEVGTRASRQLSSFRFFSEGGDFAPQEVKVFQRQLTEEMKMLSVSEEKIFREQEGFQFTSFQQVKEVADRLQEKIQLLKSEVKLREKIQKIMRRTQLLLKTQVDASNQQYSQISRRLDRLKTEMEDGQVCPHQVCSHILAVRNQLRNYCLDMDFSQSLPGSPHQKQGRTRSLSRGAVDLLEDPVVGVIRSLNRFCSVQEGAAGPGLPDPAVQSPVQKITKTPVQEVTKIPVQKITKTPVQEVTKTPVQEVTKTPVQEVTKIPVQKITKTPVQEVTKTPVQKITKTPVQKITKTPVQEVTKIPVQEVTKIPVQEVTKTPVQEVTKTPVQKITKTPVQKITKIPVQKITKIPVQKITKTPVQKITKTPVQKITKIPVQEVTKTPVQKVTKTPVQKVTKTPVQEPAERGQESTSTLSSFCSRVTSVLSSANEEVLLLGQAFYRSERPALGAFLLLPDSLELWVEEQQMSLLGEQEQTNSFLSRRRDELGVLVCVLDQMLRSSPSELLSTHEHQHRSRLRQEVDRARLKLEETLIWNQKEKEHILHQLEASLTEEELRSLDQREELRQQQLQKQLSCSHLHIQDCVQVRWDTFVSSLESLTEKLLDMMLVPDETESTVVDQPPEDSSVTTDMDTIPMSTVSRSGDPTSIITTVTTASSKRFEQLILSELSKSDDIKQQHLSDLETWKSHWRQQLCTTIHTG